MVQTHPQWFRIVELVRAGRIGQLRGAIGSFGYNADPANVRNILAYGGGALMDIGCYPIKTSRMVFGDEPVRVSGTMVRDTSLTGVDVLTSAVLEYPAGTCVFTRCSMQIVPNQSMRFYGTKGSVTPEIPFNAIPGEISRIAIDDGRDLKGGGVAVEAFAPCDQYTVQGDCFSRAIREGGQPAVPLEDLLRNMAVIDAVVRAAATGGWVKPGGAFA